MPCRFPKLAGRAAQKVATKLIAAGLVKEIRAKTGTPIWRRDEQAGQSYALRLTAAGARAIAIDEGSTSDDSTISIDPAAGTDQGLEQDFNSLDAQREASEAYIKSQAHEGWKQIRNRYDDAGFPAAQWTGLQ